MKMIPSKEMRPGDKVKFHEETSIYYEITSVDVTAKKFHGFFVDGDRRDSSSGDGWGFRNFPHVWLIERPLTPIKGTEMRPGDKVTFNKESSTYYEVTSVNHDTQEFSGYFVDGIDRSENFAPWRYAFRDGELLPCWLIGRSDKREQDEFEFETPPDEGDYDAGYQDAIDAVITLLERYGYNDAWHPFCEIKEMRGG